MCWHASATPAIVRGVTSRCSSAGAWLWRRWSCASVMMMPGRVSSVIASMALAGGAVPWGFAVA
eukprot:12892437-Prorocentrum_lima.AAC.1